MPVIRQIYESVPQVIPVPAALQHRRVEIIMLPLDETDDTAVNLSDTQRQQALQQLMQHAGAVRSGNPNAADNEQIDADLAREYGKDL